MKSHLHTIVSLILIFMSSLLMWNYRSYFSDVEHGYEEGRNVNLAPGISYKNIAKALMLNGYVQEQEDADFAARMIVKKFGEGKTLPNVYTLMKRDWQIGVQDVATGGKMIKLRWEAAKEILHQDLVDTISDCEENIDDSLHEGKGYIRVCVTQENGKPDSGVKVVLWKHYMMNGVPDNKVCGCRQTNGKGMVLWENLPEECSYSVLPVRENFEYGVPQGTVKGSLRESSMHRLLNRPLVEYRFVERPQTITIFSSSQIQQIREEHAFTVRTPDEYKTLFWACMAIFFALWWGLYAFLKRKGRMFDKTLFALLILLTGLSIILHFSINDPLVDTLLGVEMAEGVFVGIPLIGILSFFNVKKFYRDGYKMGFDFPLDMISWLFKPYKKKIAPLNKVLRGTSGPFLKCISLLGIGVCLPLLLLDVLQITRLSPVVERLLERLKGRGVGYLFLAIGLTLLLLTPMGDSVGGMRVNLNFGGLKFQPGEIVKYLMVVFMASFFSRRVNALVRYSAEGNTKLWGNKFRMFSWVFMGLASLVVLYLVLGDMGPALVLCFTFLVLYSFFKSRVDVEKGERVRWCDFAMFVYGVISFSIFLWVGYVLNHVGLFCFGWFFLWILGGLVFRKQVFESPIFFNLIVLVFLFGGNVLENTPLKSTAQRLEDRVAVCVNPWGEWSVQEHAPQLASRNAQIAEGYWALSSGGFWGQGLGQGYPRMVSAFHTDMILESMGEQWGFVGLLGICLAFAWLLRRCLVIGYRSRHTFCFYLCTGIAVASGVQFLIIAFGSVGEIPLTGISVPFFSSGKVGMILNMLAFGIVLSVSRIPEEIPVNTSATKSYNYSVSLMCYVYGALLLGCLGTFFHYQVSARDCTLIRPVFVKNAVGIPELRYNPRIKVIERVMHTGNIYDRRGVLLATGSRELIENENDKISRSAYEDCKIDMDFRGKRLRYYPFGNHLFFMLGNYNTQTLFIENEKYAYVAENRHLSRLRGYENREMKNGKPVKVVLHSDSYKPSRYLNHREDVEQTCIVRNYSSLLPYLKAGENSRRLERFNRRVQKGRTRGKIAPKDLQLTLDAVLQVRLQQAMEAYVLEQQKMKGGDENYWNKMRISVVVVSATGGDLLASAVYPLPSEEILRSISGKGYTDNYRAKTWRAYSDRDLGLAHPTAPGSTAKILSAMAALNKKEPFVDSIYIYEDQIIYHSGERAEPTKKVDMRRAIVKSSNVYFINIVNQYNLYSALGSIYQKTGVALSESKNGKQYTYMPYGLHFSQLLDKDDFPRSLVWQSMGAVEAYENYLKGMEERGHPDVRNKMDKHPAWQWVYGQGTLTATPLSLARAMSAIVNGGDMPVTRYVSDTVVRSIPLMEPEKAKILKGYLAACAQEGHDFPKGFGGKTGTPERLHYGYKSRQPHKMNDGWFVYFIENTSEPIVVAVRMERLCNSGDGEGSGKAVELAKRVVNPILKERGYIND